MCHSVRCRTYPFASVKPYNLLCFFHARPRAILRGMGSSGRRRPTTRMVAVLDCHACCEVTPAVRFRYV